MKQKPYIAHDEMATDMLREDPQFATEYLNAVLEDSDQKKRDEKRLEQMLLDGVRSGHGVEFGTKEWDEFWESIYARIRKQARKSTA